MKRLLIAAALLVLAANAAVFAHVAYNRSGEPQTVTLTERELSLPYYYSYGPGDNSGISMRLEWRVAPSSAEEPNWQYDRSMLLDEQKFLSLGFHPMENCDGSFAYGYRPRSDQPRKAWIAFEYDGPTRAKVVEWQRRQLQNGGTAKQNLEQRRRELEQSENRETRLYAIDVAADRDELAARYPGAMILAAKISNNFDCQQKYKIYVSELLTESIHVPIEYRSFFKDMPARAGNPDWTPAYRMTLAIGKLAEPWLLKVERVTDAAP